MAVIEGEGHGLPAGLLRRLCRGLFFSWRLRWDVCRGRKRYKRRDHRECCSGDRKGRGAEVTEVVEIAEAAERRECRGSNREGRGAEVTVGDSGNREEEGHGLPAGLLTQWC